MTLDPQVALSVTMMMALGWTMCFAGLKKHMLEFKRRRRICPACGRTISGRVCNAH